MDDDPSDPKRFGETVRAENPLAAVLARAEAAYARAQDEGVAAFRAAEEARRIADRQAILPEAQKRWLLSLGVPEETCDDVCLAPLAETEAMRRLAKLSAKRPVLVLAGGTGCGKTCAAVSHLLTSAGPTLVRSQCIPAAFITAVNFGRLWPRFAADRIRLAEIEKTTVLVVDDLGMEEDSLAAKLDHLIYQRAGNRRTTILTANLSEREFVERYEDRVWSRLAQSGNFEGLEDQVDLRIEKRNGR